MGAGRDATEAVESGSNQTTIEKKDTGIPEFDLSLIPDSRVEQEIIDQYRPDVIVMIQGPSQGRLEALRESLQKTS